MTRADIINALIQKFDYKSYLEIGVQNPDNNFNKINCEFKVGVDPDENSRATYIRTSDEFFASHVDMYDLIFIDGLHECGQVYRDIQNALACLNEKGTIVVHDCNPTTEDMQAVPRIQDEWTGDGWKAWVKIATENPSLAMQVVNTDYGVGIIKRKGDSPVKIDMEKLTYEHLEKNRVSLLGLISVHEFKYGMGL